MFIQNLVITSTQVLVLAILATVGYFCHKSGLFTETASKKCTGLLFYIITPSVIAQSFTKLERSEQTLRLFGTALLATVIFYILNAVLVHFIFNKSSAGAVYKYATMYGNIGYMGIPLSQAIFGDMGVFVTSVAVFTFNAFAFTHGVIIMGGREHMNLKKLLFNPGTIGILMGLPLFLWSGSISPIIMQPLTHLANLNTPFAMIVLGTFLASTKLLDTFKIPENYALLGFKLILVPAVTFAVCALFGIRGTLLGGLTLMACAPSATNTVIFAAQFGQDTGRASMCTALTSVCSIVTIPIWLALAQTI